MNYKTPEADETAAIDIKSTLNIKLITFVLLALILTTGVLAAYEPKRLYYRIALSVVDESRRGELVRSLTPSNPQDLSILVDYCKGSEFGDVRKAYYTHSGGLANQENGIRSIIQCAKDYHCEAGEILSLLRYCARVRSGRCEIVRSRGGYWVIDGPDGKPKYRMVESKNEYREMIADIEKWAGES